MRIAAAAPMTTSAPRLTIGDAERLIQELYGFAGEARPLSSERDQNLHVRTSQGAEFLLRISNPAEPHALVDFQNRALLHVADRNPALPTPRLVRTGDGREHGTVAGPEGPSIVRLFTFLPGVQVRATPRTAAQRRALGAGLAELDLALAGFDHPASQHDLLWNIAQAQQLAELMEAIAGDERRELVRRFMSTFQSQVAPRLPGLRAQVIHNDFNLYNVLVAPEQPARLTGIIDFGDIVRAPLVCEVATAAAYQMVDEPDPLGAAAEFIAGYQAVLPLTDEERELLFDLTATRHLITVLISEWRAARNPDNRAYIMRHNPEAWAALAAFDAVAHDGGRERLLQPPASGDGE